MVGIKREEIAAGDLDELARFGRRKSRQTQDEAEMIAAELYVGGDFRGDLPGRDHWELIVREGDGNLNQVQ